MLGLWARLIYVKSAAPDLRTVQGSDGLLAIFVAGHLHKSEPARAPGVAVRHNADPIHLPKRLKHLSQFVFRCVKAQVPHKNILHASASALNVEVQAPFGRTGRLGNTFLEIEAGAGGSQMRQKYSRFVK
jgi:hypothetical protein